MLLKGEESYWFLHNYMYVHRPISWTYSVITHLNATLYNKLKHMCWHFMLNVHVYQVKT